MHFFLLFVTAKQEIYWPIFVTADLRVFGIFPLTWTCEVLAFFRDLRPVGLWHFSVTTELRVFGIFTSVLPYALLTFFCDCKPGSFLAYFHDGGPASFWQFFVTADLQFFRINAELCIFGILLTLRTSKFSAIFLKFFCKRRSTSFWHFMWLRTCEFLVFFHDRGPASHFSVTADLRVFRIFA